MSFSMNRRRLLALGGLTAAGAATGATAACGGDTGRSDTGVTINQWYHQYGEAGTQQAAEKYAAAYTEADVVVGWFPGEYDAKLNSSLLTADGPDVFESHLNVSMVQSNQVVPLDDILSDVLDDFSETDIFENSIDGKVYGIKMINDPQFIYYRPSMFQAAGISAPPTTFHEFVDYAKRLTTDDVKGVYLGNDGGIARFRDALIHSTGQKPVNDDNTVGFDSQKTIDAMLELKELQDNADVMLTGAPTDWWDPSAINQGLAAMQWCGLWAMPAMQAALGDDLGVFPVPSFAGGVQTVVNGGWATFVSAGAKDLEASKKFARWLWVDKTDFQEDWSLSYGFHIPPRKSLAAKATKLQSGLPAEVVTMATDFGFGAIPSYTPVMQTAITDMYTNVTREGKDPRSELDTAAGKVETELAKVFG